MMEQQKQTVKLDGRTKRALDTAIAKRQVSQESYQAVAEGRITLAEAKELGREGSPDAPAKPESRVSKGDRSRLCLCGCENRTRGGRFVPGHDMRLVSFAKEYVRGERELTDEQREYAEQSGKLERARQQVEKEDRRKAEREMRKSEEAAQKQSK